MNQMLALIFAVFVGMVIGTMPGIRESTPWGAPRPTPEPVYVMVTPPPETPKPGAWMYERKPGALDRGSYDQRSGPGAARIINPLALPSQ